MDRTLFRPRWMAAHITVALVAVLFVGLGSWQIDRLQERRALNQVMETRSGLAPEPLTDLLAEASDDLSLIEHRRAVVTGRFDPDNEVLIRSQVYLGNAGFHVITPIVADSGDVTLVNRGWVPLTLDQVPVTEAPPPGGRVTVSGWVNLSQERPALGREEPTGPLSIFNRVDIERISAEMPYDPDPVYLVMDVERGDQLPVPVDPPDFRDEGPHLAYAIQWFSFAMIGLVGYLALIRRRLSRTSG